MVELLPCVSYTYLFDVWVVADSHARCVHWQLHRQLDGGRRTLWAALLDLLPKYVLGDMCRGWRCRATPARP